MYLPLISTINSITLVDYINGTNSTIKIKNKNYFHIWKPVKKKHKINEKIKKLKIKKCYRYS